MPVIGSDAIRDALLTTPVFLPHKLDIARQAILFVRLERDDYRAASFLDDRILTAQMQGRWVQLAEVEAWLQTASPGSAKPVHFIFHTGHVGSTLVSRLIEEAGATLALREPLPLRTLADLSDDLGADHALVSLEAFTTLLRGQLRLWARGYADTDAVVVKATSSAARLAVALLTTEQDARAVYLNLAAEPYLATLLAGENSPVDLRGHAQERARRLARLAGPMPSPLHALSLGEVAAMSWAAETLTQRAAVSETGGRVLAIDFDALLKAPADTARAVFAHLRIESPSGYCEGVADSAVFTRYSKSMEHPYSPQLRDQILAESRMRNLGEIRRGLAWLERFAARSPALAAVLSA